MQRFLMRSIFFVCFLLASEASAKHYQKVDYCEYDDKTLVETCYDENGKKVRGWAVEGEQPRSAAAQRREMRKSKRQGQWVMDTASGETYPAGGQPYTLAKYRDGKKNGLCKNIDYRGFGVKRIQYKNGVQDGKCLFIMFTVSQSVRPYIKRVG